jgi:CheY-like chemotaxis protein
MTYVLDDDLLTKGILIVEDNPVMRDTLVAVLDSGGFKRVYQASNVSQCLSVLTQSSGEILVVLLDLTLPDGTGLQIMEHLVNSHEHVVGVIVITEHTELGFAKDFFKLGTDEIIAVDYQLKGDLSSELLVEQVSRTISLIDNKRKHQSVLVQNEMWQKLTLIENKVALISDTVESFSQVDENVRAFKTLWLAENNQSVKLLDELNNGLPKEIAQIKNLLKDLEKTLQQELRRIDDRLAIAEKNSPSFIKDLGMDVLRLVIIAFAVINTIAKIS